MNEIFENKTGKEQVSSEGNVHYLVENIKYEKGIWTYIKGAEYPQKGNAPAETIFYFNIAKRIVAEVLRNKFILLGVLITNKHRIIDTYNSIIWKVISPYILKTEYMTDCAKQVRKFVYVFLREIGIEEQSARQFSSIFSHFIEYDNAYRYRVQDLLHETTIERLTKNTQKELKLFKKLSKERDSKGVSVKICSGINVLSFMLRIPKYKKAFINALSFTDFNKLQYDEIDIYWISMRNDYLYLGEEVDIRSKRNIGKSMPIPMPQAEFDRYIKDLHTKNNEMLVLRSIDILLQNPTYKKLIKQKLK